jgi:hypothetical protein
MKKLSLITFLVLILSTVSGLAQVGGNFNSNDLRSFDIYNTINTERGVVDLDNVDGSIYLDNEFKTGLVLDTNKDQEFGSLIRYNIFKDQVEINFITNENKVSVLKRSTNFEYVLNGDRIKLFLNDKIFRGGKDNGYLFILGNTSLDENQVQLYKKYYQNYTPEKRAVSSYVKAEPAKLENEVEYYISEDDKSFKQLELNKRKILQAFDSRYKSDLKDFIKSKDFNFRGSSVEVENEIKRLIYFYNTLKEN